MNILFIGLGSIGKKHYKIIKKKYPRFELFYLNLSNNKEKLKKYFNDFRDIFSSWKEIDSINLKFDIAFICNPTYLHIDQAIKCAERKINLFIEKPLSNYFDQISNLLQIIAYNNLTAYIAYPFRFNSKIRQFKNDNIENGYLSKYNGRISCFTNIDLWGKDSYSFDYKKGGGVLFELSHEIDLVEYLFGEIKVINGSLLEHKKYNIFSSAYLNVKLMNGLNIRLTLRLDSKVSYTKRFMIFEKNNTIKKYLQYSSDNKMYEKQIEYFIDNYKNNYLMNNIYSASSLLYKIIKMENRIRK